ncbi:MAG: hypothetical protein ALECFALPRED_007048 [Alectoria fallacina]|uniref:Uncharacterized protein n=1 Tax=Alectoria fallacina TaxID=1903189 RepID=A0A8H3ETA3_9LECA|nr:MAG: hypothetical protein ALECFALPRED_007048 [Alectoria fallacina]
MENISEKPTPPLLTREGRQALRSDGLKNVRIDLYDRSYKPRINCIADVIFDHDEAHPPQDKDHKEEAILPEDEDCVWDELTEVPKEKEFKLWKRRSAIPAGFHVTPLQITDLELIFQPLKLLRGVGKARINLTAGAEKYQDMRKVAKECQDAMMSNHPSGSIRIEVHGLVRWLFA